MRRMRLVLEGNLHGKNLLYKFQSDFGKGVPSVKDAHVDVRLSGDAWLRFGQWKRPFSRQQINSSGRLEMTDRSITDKAFGAGRDVGIAIRNDYEKSPEIEWTLGVFNGRGEACTERHRHRRSDDGHGHARHDHEHERALRAPARDRRPRRLQQEGPQGVQRSQSRRRAPARGGLPRASVWLEGDFDDETRSAIRRWRPTTSSRPRASRRRAASIS